jgi:hypothetical protein
MATSPGSAMAATAVRQSSYDQPMWLRWACCVGLAACESSSPSQHVIDAAVSGDSQMTDSSTALALPPVNGKLDYQLGGAYTPPAGTAIVTRDRTAAIAPSLYNICYVNGFQIQPDETSTWMAQYPDLMLRDSGGNLVVDTQWNEVLIDVGTAAKRTAVATIVGGWIDGCKQAGFDAIEIDNLDSYSRSAGLLTADNDVAAMALFSAAAHADGLAIAQKNSVEFVPRKAELGTDFVTAEECDRYAECDGYTAGYGDHVLIIEYRMADFTAGCSAYPNLSIVLRDVDLVPAGTAGYVYDAC